MRAAYSLSYRLGMSSWDKTGPDADAAFMRMLDREELERDAPFGRALDLGCGTGSHTRQLRERGEGRGDRGRHLESADGAHGREP